jgi:MFS family permease
VYWIKRATNSPSLLGLLAATAAIPVLVLNPLGGAVADRWDKPKRHTLMSGIGLLGDRMNGNIQPLYAGCSILLMIAALTLYLNADLRRPFVIEETATR